MVLAQLLPMTIRFMHCGIVLGETINGQAVADIPKLKHSKRKARLAQPYNCNSLSSKDDDGFVPKPSAFKEVKEHA